MVFIVIKKRFKLYYNIWRVPGNGYSCNEFPKMQHSFGGRLLYDIF